ncbi:MAG: hypothetical protein JO307_23680 [Bryobacterales bacterium]|nr:hypothetical protein [Bryobacterales bacterium]
MVPEQEVKAALERVLSSDNFVNAARQSAFLRFVVERTIGGDGAQLKEYLLGVEIFGRGQDFDPRLDPVVRVEARRLRAKFQEYYEGAGRAEAVRIVIRKGGYVPTFARAEEDRTAQIVPTRRPSSVWIAAACLVITGLALWLGGNPSRNTFRSW